MRDYADIARGYAADVVSGEVPAGELVRRAAQRHLDDLKRAKQKKYPFAFDEESAGKACYFIEALPHTKGRWARDQELIELEPWQVFIVCCIFGWLRKADGLRRYRTAYVEVPRKNGKSLLAAGIGLYMLVADGEFGAEVYSGATTLDQAYQTFRPAWEIVHKTPDLQDYFGLELGGTKKNPGNIYCLKQSARFEPLIGDPGDGASPSCAIVDEYHEHRTASLYETMETGMAAREQPLMLVITTAGNDIGGPCYAMRADVVKVLEGTIEGDETFALIYAIDKGDDWTSDTALRKANPNLGVSVTNEWLLSQRAEAINSVRKQSAFKTKHLNQWLTARDGWMNMEAWNRQADTTLREEDFAGEECWLGIDLSSKQDITSRAKLFRREVDGKEHYYLFTKHFLPEAKVEAPENDRYRNWAAADLITVTPGNVIDHRAVEEVVLADDEAHTVVTAGYDPWNATDLAVRLSETGMNVLEIPQRTRYLSEPMQWIEALVVDGRFHHPGCPVTNWMISNVVVKPDANDAIFPRKDRPENKIDAASAMIIAQAVAMRAPEPKPIPRIRTL